MPLWPPSFSWWRFRFRFVSTATLSWKRRCIAMQIQPEAAGVVYRVLVHEEAIKSRAGDVLAEMENWNSRYSLAEAQARLTNPR